MVENVTQIKRGITINVNVRAKIREKGYIWNPSRCACENGKYLERIIGDSVITCDEIIGMTKAIPTKSVPIVKQKLFIFYLPFY